MPKKSLSYKRKEKVNRITGVLTDFALLMILLFSIMCIMIIPLVTLTSSLIFPSLFRSTERHSSTLGNSYTYFLAFFPHLFLTGVLFIYFCAIVYLFIVNCSSHISVYLSSCHFLCSLLFCSIFSFQKCLPLIVYCYRLLLLSKSPCYLLLFISGRICCFLGD